MVVDQGIQPRILRDSERARPISDRGRVSLALLIDESNIYCIRKKRVTEEFDDADTLSVKLIIITFCFPVCPLNLNRGSC